MLKTKLFQPLIPAFFVLLLLNACKSSGYYTETGSAFILELSPGLNREYLLEHHGNFEGIRLEVGNMPVNKTKNEWVLKVFHTRSRDFEAWKKILEKDQNIVRFFPAENIMDPPVNDTIKGVKKIKPTF